MITKIQNLRAKLDKIDQTLVNSLKKRQDIVINIGQLKKQHGLPPLDPKRWQQVLETRRQWGSEMGLDPIFIEHIFEVIHNYSLQIEEQV